MCRKSVTVKDNDLLDVNCKRTVSGTHRCTFWRVIRIDRSVYRTVQRFAVNAVERGIADSTRDNGSSATPHSSARKGDKSPASSNRSSLVAIDLSLPLGSMQISAEGRRPRC